MNNPFEELEKPEREVPLDLKPKVMKDIASIKLLMDITGLFTSNYSKVAESFFKGKSKNKPNN